MGANRRKKPAWLRYAEREGMTSAMNATKWREVAGAMRDMRGGPPRFRIKDIEGPEPSDNWDREWFYHPLPWETIEWLEISPDPGQEPDIVAALRSIGVLFTMAAGRLRIRGWLRSDVQ
jgi:hypothetical protein